MKKILSDAKGDVFVGILLQTLVTVTLVLTVVNTYDLFWKYQNVIFLTRNLVRTVELDGSTDNVETVWNNLTASMGLDRASYRMTGAFIGTKIQLREPFIVTVTVPYELDVFGAHGRAASLNFTLKSSLQGLSEVYWKDDEL